MEIDPEFAEAYNNLGAVYFQLGKYKESIWEYQKALDFLPDYAEAHMGLGMAYYLWPEKKYQLSPHLRRAEELFDQKNEWEKRRQASRILMIIRMRNRVGKTMLKL